MNKSICSFIVLLCFVSSGIIAQATQTTTKKINPKVDVTYAEFLGTTPQIKSLINLPPTSAERKKLSKRNRKAPKNFVGRGVNKIVRPELENQGPDVLRQTSFSSEVATVVEPLVNVNGLSIGGAPHDPTGDIGENHYVQAINVTTIGVFDKEGTLLNSFTGNTLWGSIGFSSAGDPIVLYDQEFKRWIITEFPSGNQLLIAVSETADPMGAYDVYNFATPNFPDYPKYGIWNNAYTVTTNENGGGALECYLIDRAALLAGNASVPIQRIELPGNSNTEAGFFVGTPVDWTGLTPPNTNPLFLSLDDSSWGSAAEDQINVFTVNVDFNDPNNTTFETTSIVVSPYDSNPCSATGVGFSCVPQSGGTGLDAIPEVIMQQAHYRNFGTHESMVFNFITDVTNGNNLSGIRWIELRRTGGDWSLYQEGTFAPNDGKDRFMGSICMDGNGNIGLAYNITSEDSFVGVAFTGRRASDPLGEMTVDEFVAVEGMNSISSGGRFGDYSHMSIDPTNDRTFWFTTEYANSTGGGDVDTRILAFELRRDTTDIGPSAILSPESSPDLTSSETVTVEFKNFGLDTQQVFQVGYIFENGTPVIDNVTFDFFPDSIYTHTFTPTVDMSVVGDYQFKVFTVLADDQAILNDTLRATISKLPRWDAAITAIDGLDGVSCGDTLNASIVLQNFGTETLTSATVQVELNGSAYQTINWTGSINSGETETIPLQVIGVINGTNNLSATSSNPNNTTDEIMANDGFSRDFEALTNGVEVTLNINTDDYPAETTWEVSNEQGTVILSGGPYPEANTLATESWCLDPDACYTFTIFDSYGDGICCGFGDGNYSIVDANGNALLASTGEFMDQEFNEFCATFACMLEADIDLSAISTGGTSDGAILITAMNGSGPFQYSIDGGQTFQNSPMFNGLTAGSYDIVVQGAGECLYEETVTLETCVLSFGVDVQSEIGSGAMNGSITINVTNGNAPYQYSVDGGQNYQNMNVFENLTTGEYVVNVLDDLGCVTSQTVMVDFQTSTSNILSEQSIEIFPNPTEGVFKINITGLEQNSVFLKLEIYDVSGKRIQTTSIVRYNDTFTGQVSLIHYPSGTYFVRFLNNDLNRMVKVVKK